MPLIYGVPPQGDNLASLIRTSRCLKSQQRFPNCLRRICLEDSLFAVLEPYRQIGEKNEAGGVLIGIRSKYEIRVETATEPGKGDRSSRWSFERDPRRAQRSINSAWKESKGHQNYLGEWHTHPEPYPRPSLQDRTMIRQMFRETQPSVSPLLLLIFGTKSLWLGCHTDKGLSESIHIAT